MVFIWWLWCATEDIPEEMVVKAAWVKNDKNLTVLSWRRWLRCCSFVVVKPVGYFWLLYFVFSLVLANLMLDACFVWFSLPNLPAFATWSGFVGRWAMLLTLNITELTDNPLQIVLSCFYSAVSVRLEVIH